MVFESIHVMNINMYLFTSVRYTVSPLLADKGRLPPIQGYRTTQKLTALAADL